MAGKYPSTCHPEEVAYGDGLCRKCYQRTPKSKAKYNTWVSKNKPKLALAQRKHRFKRIYKITIEQYDKLVIEQNNLCKICSLPQRQGTRLYVDHDHMTGKVRGLLCITCNMVLGYFDNPQWRQSMMAYLQEDHRLW